MGTDPRRQGERREHLFSHGDGVMRAEDLREQDQELVAAVPAHRVRIADRGLQSAGHELQDLVADRMAMGVVDLLETIEVHEQNADPARTALGQRDGALETIQHERPIRGAGQLVVLAVSGQLVQAADHRLRDRVGMEGGRDQSSVSLLELGRPQAAELLPCLGELASQPRQLDPSRIDLCLEKFQGSGRRSRLGVVV